MASINKRVIIFFGAMATTLAIVLIIAGRPAGPIERETIAVTIFPLYDLVKNIAPEQVEVVLLLPPGASPHTFEPTPSTIKALERAKVLFAVGHGLDDWAVTLAEATDTPVVDNYSGLQLRESEEGAEAGEDGQGGVDPHYWLSVDNAIAMTATISVEITAQYPEYRDDITTNHNSMLGRLRDADYRIRKQLENVTNRKMVTMHDAWYYFTDAYGLEIAAAFEPAPGREPTPQYLTEVGDAAREAGVRTIYSEPQLGTTALESFARDNGLTIAVLDPIGGTEGRANYVEMMLYNARTISENQ